MSRPNNVFRGAAEDYNPDRQPVTCDDLLAIVETRAAAGPSDTILRCALRSFARATRPLPPCSSLEVSLREWAGRMMADGVSRSTRRRYMGKLHALYLAATEGTHASDPFPAVSETMRDLAECPPPAAGREEIARAMQRWENAGWDQTHDMFLCLLLDPALTVADLARLRSGDPLPPVPLRCEERMRMRRDPRASYLFSLGQGKERTAAIERKVVRQLAGELAAAGIRFPEGFSRSSLTRIWTDAALGCGFCLAEMRDVAGESAAAITALAAAGRLTCEPRRRKEILTATADAFCGSAAGWFVMKLRAGVAPAAIRARLDETSPGLSGQTTLYYPLRPVVRREKGRIVTREEPWLPGILFFRTGPGSVDRIFRSIGDLAWCFRTSGPGTPCATVPTAEMERFMRHISVFPPDIEITIADTAAVGAGRRVRIIGGIMEGYEGTVIDTGLPATHGMPGTQRTFLLRLTDNSALRWTVSVPDALIRPLD